MPSHHHHLHSPILSYPNSNHIVCPLPRRTHSYHHHSHPYHHQHHQHHHQHSRFRKSNTLILSLQSDQINQQDDSDQDKEDEVLSEFLSLFIPSSPTISMTPVPSPSTLPTPSNHLPKHRKLPSHRPRSQIGLGSEDTQIESRSHSANAFHHTHLNWLIASPISRCHNPLPKHAELDALASRLADPIQGLVLTDRTSDERPELLPRTLTGTEFKTSTVNDHRLQSPVLIA
ncbi:hypothetical protein CROQUDRAFT_670452 [Cronartium quercuum f. sp. fusiforme G11]|uniref:Uncharacterized protein n=1 Tax=Cronartium quercuum f. sp. fusiforme G11 TaxID=708437 RepID=A0A9P6NNU9_9BASI|nr:hypothetical protein CROQUDRAFT_670452 [Cronartium quercuum f. sp. fusiforme G11]